MAEHKVTNPKIEIHVAADLDLTGSPPHRRLGWTSAARNLVAHSLTAVEANSLVDVKRTTYMSLRAYQLDNRD